jgi:hypothetical protein
MLKAFPAFVNRKFLVQGQSAGRNAGGRLPSCSTLAAENNRIPCGKFLFAL